MGKKSKWKLPVTMYECHFYESMMTYETAAVFELLVCLDNNALLTLSNSSAGSKLQVIKCGGSDAP